MMEALIVILGIAIVVLAILLVSTSRQNKKLKKQVREAEALANNAEFKFGQVKRTLDKTFEDTRSKGYLVPGMKLAIKVVSEL